jgi:23S rRNA (cytidine1920-2'-O)/16S rRNA (cytidine1409-2'-O)-methyltransferase
MAALTTASSIEEGFAQPEMVLLVKPQFEAGRQEVSRGRGVITDPEIHLRAIDTVTASVEQCGGSVESVVESPIKGAEGNIEFLMWVKCPLGSLGCVS